MEARKQMEEEPSEQGATGLPPKKSLPPSSRAAKLVELAKSKAPAQKSQERGPEFPRGEERTSLEKVSDWLIKNPVRVPLTYSGVQETQDKVKKALLQSPKQDHHPGGSGAPDMETALIAGVSH